MKIKTQIQKLEKFLSGHPLFNIIDFNLNAGVENKYIDDFKKKYGFDLSTDVTELYTEMNGFTLVYSLKNTDQKALDIFTKNSPYSPERNPIGSFNFLPFEEVFLENTWQEILYDTNSMTDDDEFIFNREKYTYNTFGKLLKPFDTYADESCAAFLLTEKNRFNVILLEDYYADWKNSRIVEFDTYIKFILITGGLKEARDFFLSEIDGDAIPKQDFKNSKKWIPRFFDDLFPELK